MFEMPMMLMMMGAAMGGLNSVMQGRAMSNAANYNATLNNYNATLSQQSAATEETRQRQLGYRQLSTMRAGYGASGVTLEGSPMDVLEQSAANAEMDSLLIRHAGATKAWSYNAQAELDRFEGRQAKSAGWMNAASSLLGASGKIMATAPKLTRTGSGFSAPALGGYNNSAGDFGPLG